MRHGFEIKPSDSSARSGWKLGADGRPIDESEEQKAKAERQAAALARVASAISGRKVDDDPGAAGWFGGTVVSQGAPAKVEEVGDMRGLNDPKQIDWTATMRAWERPPEPTLAERIASLEDR